MARQGKVGSKKPVAKSEIGISQIFKVDQSTYMRVRMLAAARRGSGRAATAQDIYVEAISQYLERNGGELREKIA